jgi:hypothetical protein
MPTGGELPGRVAALAGGRNNAKQGEGAGAEFGQQVIERSEVV